MVPDDTVDSGQTDKAVKGNSGLLLWSVCAVVVILLSLIRTLPWFPRVIPVSADDSWDLALNFFFQHGARAGSDYIFTFGPLGLLYNKTFFPATFAAKLLGQAFFCASTVLVLLMQGRHMCRKLWLSLVWIFSLVTLYAFFSDVFFLAAPILLLNQYFLIDRPPASGADRKEMGKNGVMSFETILLTVLLAMSAVVKFTFFVAAAWVLAFLTIDQVVVRRRVPLLLVMFTAVMLIVWLSTGQPLNTLPAYFITSLAVASGHSEAMSASESGWLMPIVATIFATSLLLFVFAWLTAKRLKFAAWTAVLAQSGLFF